MTQTGIKKITIKVKEYVKENWGSPFIVGFILLLLTAAFCLSANLSSSAGVIAEYAYFALVVGVALQLVCFLKYTRKVGENT